MTEAVVLLQMVASDTGPTITGVDKDNLQQYLNELFQAVLKVPKLGPHYCTTACFLFACLWPCIAPKNCSPLIQLAELHLVKPQC